MLARGTGQATHEFDQTQLGRSFDCLRLLHLETGIEPKDLDKFRYDCF